jgi:hypothetical protein
MSLRVMTLVGCLVLVLGFMMFWLAPAKPLQPRSVKPIGTSAVSHGGSSSAGQPRSRMDRSDSIGLRDELDLQRR